MSDVWFTSDTHFGHRNIIRFCDRPFDSVEEMDEALIQNWNSVVKPGDSIYHLGDLTFAKEDKIRYYLSRLNGNKFLCLGNHDDHKANRRLSGQSGCWSRVWDVRKVHVGNTTAWLSHYAHRTWNKAHHGVYHFYGHSHGGLEPWGKSCDVGVDCWNYTPVNFDTLRSLLDKQPEISHHATKEIWKGV